MNAMHILLLFQHALLPTEPGHSTSCKIPQCASSENSDQSVHTYILIRVVNVFLKTLRILGHPQFALRKLWSGNANAQADLSFWWALAGHACNPVRNAVSPGSIYFPTYSSRLAVT